MMLELSIAQDAEAKEWDALITTSSQGTLFHTWNWLKITAKHTHSQLIPLIGRQDGRAVAVFPLFVQKKGFITMVFSPPPHASIFYLGPVFPGYSDLKQDKKEKLYIEFQRTVNEYIESVLHAQYVSISLCPSLADPRPFTWTGYSIFPQYDYSTDLSLGPEFLFQTLDKKLRQNLNRAVKRGMSVELGGRDEYNLILDLMDSRYEEQNKVVMESREYFLDIYDTYKDYLKIFVAKLEGEVISGCIDFHYHDSHYSWIGNPRPRKIVSPSPNDLLIWESVKYACEQHCKKYVCMSAAGNQRLHEYYASKFNPDLQVRYLAIKKSLFADVMETGYKKILKPLREKNPLKTLKSKNEAY